jgi:hypothetical protein
MTVLAQPIRTRTLLQTAHLSTPIIAPCPQHVGRRIAHIRLREASNEPVRRICRALDALLEQISSNPLIIPARMRVVLQHTRPVDRKPGQHAHILEVACSPEPEEGKLLVHTVAVLRPLFGWIS